MKNLSPAKCVALAKANGKVDVRIILMDMLIWFLAKSGLNSTGPVDEIAYGKVLDILFHSMTVEELTDLASSRAGKVYINLTFSEAFAIWSEVNEYK